MAMLDGSLLEPRAAGVDRVSEHMPWVYDDGGRGAAGFKGKAGDCVARAIAIASGLPYGEVYKALADGSGRERGSRGRSARNGIFTRREWFKRYMQSIGFRWTPTMRVGEGCRVHLVAGELPMGRLVVNVSRHETAVIDGVIRDTFDPQRRTYWFDGPGPETIRITERCVYGYWSMG